MDSADSKEHAFTAKEIADLLQMTDQYAQWYVNLRTGETAYTSDMSMSSEERGEVIDRIEGEDGWAALPDSFALVTLTVFGKPVGEESEACMETAA